LNGHTIAQNALLRDSRKLAVVTAQTIRLSYASFRTEPQRFGHIRSSYAPVQPPFLGSILFVIPDTDQPARRMRLCRNGESTTTEAIS